MHVARSGNDVVKNAHELKVEEKANEPEEKPIEETYKPVEEQKKVEEKEEMQDGADLNGVAKAGDKHAREDEVVENGSKVILSDVEMKDAEGGAVKGVENGFHAENGDSQEKDGEPAAKKQKTVEEDNEGTQESEKKARGRPKKTDSQNGKASSKKREPKLAATLDGKPRRSSRLGG